MAHLIRRKASRTSANSRMEILLEKASRQMLKDSRDLTVRKGSIDEELNNLRLSQADAPVRKLRR